MSTLALVYGVMASIAAILAASGHDSRSTDASRPTFAVLILISWAATELARMTGSLQAWPAMDALLACMLASSHFERPKAWKLALLGTYVAQAMGHVAYQSHDDGSDLSFMVYASANNALFVLQLVIIAREGGRKAWDDVRDRLHVYLRGRDHLRAGAFQTHARRNEGVGDEDVPA